MNKFLLSLIAIATLLSCSTEEVIVEDTTTDTMLKSFVVSRNADGSYAVSHKVSENVNTLYTDTKTTKEIFLFEDSASEKSCLSNNYLVENNELNILFVDENNSVLPSVSISDNNTSAKSGDLELLNTYSFAYNADGTLELNFKVENGVDVAFGNQDGINDIYLSEGNSTKTDYTQSYSKENGSALQIDFVQTLNKDVEIKHPSITFDEE